VNVCEDSEFHQPLYDESRTQRKPTGMTAPGQSRRSRQSASDPTAVQWLGGASQGPRWAVCVEMRRTIRIRSATLRRVGKWASWHRVIEVNNNDIRDRGGATLPKGKLTVLIMRIRPYATADRETCLKIFRGNVPTYFAASDESQLANFLDGQMGHLWVVVHDAGVVACGGVALDHPETGIATLCWGMVAADKHRHGIGSALLHHRIEYVAAEQPATRLLRINTTQLAQGFYERHGFVAVKVVADGYGVGLDHVVMDRLNRQ
jgi:ribosomal-protein-alanine N-acetyltransferase